MRKTDFISSVRLQHRYSFPYVLLRGALPQHPCEVNIIWFWLFYYAGLIICIRIAYGRLSGIKGAGPSKMKQLFTNPPSKNDGDISIIDRIVLYVTQIVMLTVWFALLISTIVFCIQYKQIFGL